MRRNVVQTLLLSLALFANALIPSGWMPTGGQAFEITVCTGTDTHSLWLDRAGKLRKQDPDKKNSNSDSKSCAFAGLGAAVDLPVDTQPAIEPQGPNITTPAPRLVAAIGKGLAAPPPPQTGPPLLT